MSEKILEIKQLNKILGGQKILKDINLDIYAGEIFGLIGPNGAGKTTLMKILAGIMHKDDGEVNWFVSEKSRIGVLLETPAAYKQLSGMENLKILADMYTDIKKNDLAEVVRLTGLEKHIHKKVSDYSVGMKQRLGIAMALLDHPECIILDEPTNGLDFEGISAIRKLLIDLTKERNCTVILSSHMLDEMTKLCNRAAFIKNGEAVRVIENADIRSKGIEAYYKEIFEVAV